ncbi:MAG TPA: hypothetical protein VHY91_06920 [Pirellulales bacterium]|jgi:hypothetical protein|nr:hypothetical protein [Pirellulales bacterium]
MSATSHGFEHNPFATRNVRPGAIPYFFPAGVDAARLVERLAAGDWRGQIIGPHGSGKSTLLTTLLPEMEARDRRPRLIALHDGQRRLPERLERMPEIDERAVIVVDGYEQLGWWARWRLDRLCQRRGCGLLVTAHRPVGLPLVLETLTTAELAEQLVERLTRDTSPIDRQEVVARFAARGGNLREVLFDCYDLYRRRAAESTVPRVATAEASTGGRASEDFSSQA